MSNDLDRPLAEFTGLDVTIEHAIERLHPLKRDMARVRPLVQSVFSGRLTQYRPELHW